MYSSVISTRAFSLLLLLIFFLSLLLIGCGGQNNQSSIPFPDPDPIDAEGDELYSIYRKGLITRHLTRNGRVLEYVALESIDDFTLEQYDGSGRIRVESSSDKDFSHPIQNIRYSYESVPPGTNPTPHLWVPAIGLAKNPGAINSGGYYAVGGGEDNPLYWGGMALATFSLESIHDVSEFSIHYARKIVRFMLMSEMNMHNGYILRKGHYFTTSRSKNGERVIQGASSEELLGMMLGLMYYIRAEQQNHPLRDAAIDLRDRVLSAISRGELLQADLSDINLLIQFWQAGQLITKYEHPFMISHHDPSYRVKHLEFPFYASKGSQSSTVMEGIYRNFVTLSSGLSRSTGEFFTDTNFFDYPMFLTSMILVLEGDIPDTKKEEYAKIFMEHYIKAAMTSGPDQIDLDGNAYMGVVAKMANKYLNSTRDSELESATLQSIWSGEMLEWNALMNSVELKISSAKSLNNATNLGNSDVEISENRNSWQHNLPFMRIRGDNPAYWKDFNPLSRIGGFFIWHDRWPYVYRRQHYKWRRVFPATYEWPSSDWLENEPMDVNDVKFLNNPIKQRSTTSYLKAELVGYRNHTQNQVEGAGLGLLFLRMLLTQINPHKYPPPKIIEDRSYHVLPYPGPQPGSPDILRYGSRYWSAKTQPPFEPFKIGGDVNNAMAMIRGKLSDPFNGTPNVLIAYADESDHLILKPIIVDDSDGDQPRLADVAYNSEDENEKFDKVRMASWYNSTDVGEGDEMVENESHVVVVERAEKDVVGSNPHWLRIKLFKWSYNPSRAGSIEKIAEWNDPENNRYTDGKEDLDMTVVGDQYVAIIFRTRHEKNRIKIFRIDRDAGSIEPYFGPVDASQEEDPPHGVWISTASDNIIITATQLSEDEWRVRSRRMSGASLVDADQSIARSGKLLDMETVRKIDYSSPNNKASEYLIAAQLYNSQDDDNNHLRVISWEIKDNGDLEYKGFFNTNKVNKFLTARELDYENTQLTPVYYDNEPGFVIIGKGVARAIRDPEGGTQTTPKGLKLVYGKLLDDGAPTLLDSDYLGSGDESDFTDLINPFSDPSYMSQIAGSFVGVNDLESGVLVGHKTNDDELMLTYWYFKDEFEGLRWE